MAAPLKQTKSVCPSCYSLIDADIVEDKGKVWMEKECSEHGRFREIYWGDAALYKKFLKYSSAGKGPSNPKIKGKPTCPFTCGLCKSHQSRTVLATVFLTNRCDLACYYCFANATRENYVYEPSFEQVEYMLSVLRSTKPIPTPAVMFTGGEPTLRDDLADIIKLAKKKGFNAIFLNTNGIKIAHKPELAREYKKAGADILYLSFDGVTLKTNPKNHNEIPKILEACREAGLPIVLVPTMVKGQNDHEAGGIINFALENMDIVYSVNFQPVSFVGSMPRKLREKQRITIPELLEKIEEQTNGVIKKKSFYPPPSAIPLLKVFNSFSRNPNIEYSTSPLCGVGTYVFKKGRKTVTVDKFIDISRLYETLVKLSKKDMSRVSSRLKCLVEFIGEMNKVVDRKKCLSDISILRIGANLLAKRQPIPDFFKNSLFIGTMHFQDAYNLDIERVERCVVHYVTPGGRIIPFCAYNGLPELYRERIQRAYSTPVEECEVATGRKGVEDGCSATADI